MFLFPILLAVIIYLMVIDKKAPRQSSQNQDMPLEQLKKRYVLGEIDEETFMRMKKNITE